MDQRISRWTLGDRSRTISDDGEQRVEQAIDGGTVRVRLEPGGRIDTLPAGIDDARPAARVPGGAGEASRVEEVELDGVDAYRLEVPCRPPGGVPAQVRSAAAAGGARGRRRRCSYRVVEWLPESRAQLELQVAVTTSAARSSVPPMKPILPIALAALLLLPAAADAVTRGTVVPESRLPMVRRPAGLRRDADRSRPRAHRRPLPHPDEGFEEITLTLGESFPSGHAPEGAPARARPALPERRARADGALRPRGARTRRAGHGVTPLPVRRRPRRAPARPRRSSATGRRRWFGLDPRRHRSASAGTPGRSSRRAGDRLRRRCRSYYAQNRYKRDFFDAADMICSLDPRSRERARARRGRRSAWATAAGRWSRAGSSSAWCRGASGAACGMTPRCSRACPKLRDFALGEPVWAPVAAGVADCRRGRRRLPCARRRSKARPRSPARSGPE